MSDEHDPQLQNGPIPEEETPQDAPQETSSLPNVGEEADTQINEAFRRMMERNFLDYASYVIGSRAIPDVDDGLKPVQRRILWTLYQIYDNGRTTKTANVVGNAMHYHPHGDASIGDALVVLANKGGCIDQLEREKDGKETLRLVNVPYFIAKEGNFGNIVTGTPAAAARYTECSLTKLAYETMFNNDITAFVPNYDGREREPVLLPAKVPSLLMLGSDGIAVGMSTMILPHNFNELIDAEIAHLKGEEFHLYPDFQQGGLMDVREYEDGNGRILLRAKIEIDGRDLVIREIPAACTTASLIASIERAAEKNKIRISNIQDFTSDRVEIRITPTRGYDPEKTLQGLFMYTDCSVSLSPKMTVICEHRPVQMTVSEVLRRNVEKLLGYLKREFEIDLERQMELRHAKTLAQLFFENRIYKRIEECGSPEEEYKEVLDGLAPFRDQLYRDVTHEDVDKLLALPVRRIARFDIEKNQQELREIAQKIKEIKHHLNHLVEYTISYLEELKKKFGADFPRRTEIEKIEQIDRTKAALNNIKIGWDRKNGYIGTSVKSDDTVLCNEFDRLVCTVKNGTYKVIALPPEKFFIGRLYDFRRYDAKTVFGIVYKEKKTGKYYAKRSSIGGFILDKEYHLIPEGCQLELMTPRADSIYQMILAGARGKEMTEELNLMEFPLRAAKARGLLLTAKTVTKLTHERYLTEEELAQYQDAETEEESSVEDTEPDSGNETPASCGESTAAPFVSSPVPEKTPAVKEKPVPFVPQEPPQETKPETASAKVEPHPVPEETKPEPVQETQSENKAEIPEPPTVAKPKKTGKKRTASAPKPEEKISIPPETPADSVVPQNETPQESVAPKQEASGETQGSSVPPVEPEENPAAPTAEQKHEPEEVPEEEPEQPPEPTPESKHEPKEAPEAESANTLLPDMPEASTNTKPSRKRTMHLKGPAVEPRTAKEASDEPAEKSPSPAGTETEPEKDEFGIVQPEFGF